MLPDREIHVVDSLGASMAEGILARMGVELAGGWPVRGRDRRDARVARARHAACTSRSRRSNTCKKGGRISGTQAAIGTLLSVKPIIAVKHGVVDDRRAGPHPVEGPRAALELIFERPIERLAILHTMSPDVEAFRDEVLRRLPDIDPETVTVELVGPSVGPHLGPGCVGAAVMYRPS